VPKERRQLVTLKLPRALAGRLRALSRKNGQPQAEILREGLALRLEAESSRGAGSVLDLIGDLVGSLRGPRDLGSNPKHLRGFGE
jgi:ribbon-helix-helix CopG family protein